MQSPVYNEMHARVFNQNHRATNGITKSLNRMEARSWTGSRWRSEGCIEGEDVGPSEGMAEGFIEGSDEGTSEGVNVAASVKFKEAPLFGRERLGRVAASAPTKDASERHYSARLIAYASFAVHAPPQSACHLSS